MLQVTHKVIDNDRGTRVSKVIRVFGLVIYRYSAVEIREDCIHKAIGYTQCEDLRTFVTDDEEIE